MERRCWDAGCESAVSHGVQWWTCVAACLGFLAFGLQMGGISFVFLFDLGWWMPNGCVGSEIRGEKRESPKGWGEL